MSDIERRRHLRRQKILENSASRRDKIFGIAKPNADSNPGKLFEIESIDIQDIRETILNYFDFINRNWIEFNPLSISS